MLEEREAGVVVVLRDGRDGVEVLLLLRNRTVEFAGGSYVFPGGKVEDEDRNRAAHHRDVARYAAVREAMEEAGLNVSAESLAPLSYWEPPAEAPRRFLTWYFITSSLQETVVVDGSEIVDFIWLTPDEALSRHGLGQMELSPPTWITLHQLRGYASARAAIAQARDQEPFHFHTRFARSSSGFILLYEGDAGWGPQANLEVLGPRRRLDATRLPWVWEHTP